MTLHAPGSHVALFVRSFRGGGGAERVMLNLAGGLADLGARVDLVMARKAGHFLDEVPDHVDLIDLAAPAAWLGVPALALRSPGDAGRLLPVLLSGDAPRVVGAIPRLADYLDRARPDALVSALNYTNVAALIAARRARHRPRTVVTLHNNLSAVLARPRATGRRNHRLAPLLAHYLPQADHVVAVSRGVARDAAHHINVAPERIETVYNPVITRAAADLAAAPPGHPWLVDKAMPVVLGIGKLKPQKDFFTLIRAFARLREHRQARLIVLGEGPQRRALEALAADLGVARDVDLPGFVANPWAMLRCADAFALSSVHEGFGNVIVEALACGCPVVSTDCPSGPDEILDSGRYGRLVPVGDAAAMAEALEATLSARPAPEPLRARAAEFSVARAASQYLDLLAPAGG